MTRALAMLALLPGLALGGEWETAVDRAVEFYRKTQEPSGAWASKLSPGVTGIVVTGLLKTGRVGPKDPMIDKALKHIESMINAKEGHIAGKDPHVKLKNYVTAVNLLALVTAGRDSHKAAIKDAARFLRQLQWDEGEKKAEKDDFFGGAGYDSKSRPDLSNTQIFLDALVAAGIPKDDPAFKKALIFVSRCQNFKSEFNDQAWAGKVNDGSFIYTAAGGGDTKVTDKPDPEKGLPGYGSMTYAGVKSMIYCGVPKTDPRMVKAMEWIRANYTVDENPGMPGTRKEWGLYYYYHTMAKCLDLFGADELTDSKGARHDWRADITRALVKRQNENGTWTNKADRWMEGDPHLVTGYALMTLALTKPKK
jgi:squalene-hopene/tetraprenyl-beta-curcumene cyclase